MNNIYIRTSFKGKEANAPLKKILSKPCTLNKNSGAILLYIVHSRKGHNGMIGGKKSKPGVTQT